MSAASSLEKEIREAYKFLREKNSSTPSDTLDFMLTASLEKLEDVKATGLYLKIANVNAERHMDVFERAAKFKGLSQSSKDGNPDLHNFNMNFCYEDLEDFLRKELK